MITESVVCVILHCSRCNTAFRDEADDEYTGTVHWDTADDIVAAFKKGLGEHGGWRHFDNRVVCGRCQICTGYADDPDAREVPEPLPAAEADKVARAQATYKQPLGPDAVRDLAEQLHTDVCEADTAARICGDCMSAAAAVLRRYDLLEHTS